MKKMKQSLMTIKLVDDVVISESISSVEIESVINNGEKIATIAINGISTDISSAQAKVIDHLDEESELPVQSKALYAKLSEMQTNINIALYAENLVNQIVLTQASAFYYSSEDEEVQIYPSLQSALAANPTFEGRVSLGENILFKHEDNMLSVLDVSPVQETQYSGICLDGRKLTIDLNNNEISSTCSYVFDITNNSEITLKNGKITSYGIQTGNGGFLLNNGGKLKLENVKVNILDSFSGSSYPVFVKMHSNDLILSRMLHANGDVYDVDGVNSTIGNQDPTKKDHAIFLRTGSVIPTRCEFRMDRFSELVAEEMNQAVYGIWMFGPKPMISIDKKPATYASGKEYEAFQPYAYVDGVIKILCSEEMKENDQLLASPCYCNYTLGNELIGMKLEIGEHASILVDHGHGLFISNENSSITVNGGKIVGSNGATIRSGHLTIPRTADPTIIGIEDWHEYDPKHPSGQAGATLFVGHAVMLESNSIHEVDEPGYGKLYQPKIESGFFISKNNTSIASYSSYNANHKSYNTRLSSFVEGGMMNRTPTTNEYNYETGQYSDYGIIASGYTTSVPTMVIKENI